eukprot:scaffold294_cov221-Amphora_coffeaeformis.AAC.17
MTESLELWQGNGLLPFLERQVVKPHALDKTERKTASRWVVRSVCYYTILLVDFSTIAPVEPYYTSYT